VTLIALALALLIGVSLGLLGGGGSILAVPILVYVAGFGAKEAIAMSLVVVGVAAAYGTVGHLREGNVNARVAGLFGGISMAGTFLGARLATLMTGQAQLLLFAVVMLVAAVFMLRGRVPLPSERQTSRSPGWWVLVGVEGLAVGVLTGLVGVGGGFLIVPALVLLAGIPMKQAIGTSLAIIALKSVTGFLGYLDQVVIAWGFLALFTLFALLGIQAGVVATRHVTGPALRRGFAIFLLFVGGWLVYDNLGALAPAAAAAPPAPAEAQ
jgi:uncharacterized protein